MQLAEFSRGISTFGAIFYVQSPFYYGAFFMYNYSLCIKDSPHAPPTLHKKRPIIRLNRWHSYETILCTMHTWMQKSRLLAPPTLHKKTHNKIKQVTLLWDNFKLCTMHTWMQKSRLLAPPTLHKKTHNKIKQVTLLWDNFMYSAHLTAEITALGSTHST